MKGGSPGNLSSRFVQLSVQRGANLVVTPLSAGAIPELGIGRPEQVLFNFQARHPSTLPTICHINASRLSSISSNFVRVFTKAAQLKPVCVRTAMVAVPGNEPVCQKLRTLFTKTPFA